MFAKIFTGDEFGQVVVMKKTNDDGNPEIRFYYETENEDLDVCETAYAYHDTEDGWNKRDKKFEEIELDVAKSITLYVRNLLKNGENL